MPRLWGETTIKADVLWSKLCLLYAIGVTGQLDRMRRALTSQATMVQGKTDMSWVRGNDAVYRVSLARWCTLPTPLPCFTPETCCDWVLQNKRAAPRLWRASPGCQSAENRTRSRVHCRFPVIQKSLSCLRFLCG